VTGTSIWVVTAEALIVKLALVVPALMVMFAGTLATVELLLVKATVTPPVGAAPLSVTVPVLDAPPINEVGFRVTEEMISGFTVRLPD